MTSRLRCGVTPNRRDQELSETAIRKGSWVRRVTGSFGFRGVPRLLYATREWVLGKELGVFELEDGIRMVLDPGDYFQCMMYYGRFCPEILQVLQQFVRPGDTVLDIGAQLGYFSLHVARLVTSAGRVYCFEPDPRSFTRLNQAIELSRIDWITAFQTALSAREGTMDFYLSPTLGWSTGVKNSHLEDLQQVSARTAPLDLLVSRGDIPPHIRLAKIDVEGFEMEVLRGMQNVLATSRPILVLEINTQMLHAQGTSPSEIVRFLEPFEYRVSRIDKDLRWWRSRPRMRLYPADASLLGDCDLVCTPSECLAIGTPEPSSEL